jgi:hypothetical protein
MITYFTDDVLLSTATNIVMNKIKYHIYYVCITLRQVEHIGGHLWHLFHNGQPSHCDEIWYESFALIKKS